MKINACWLYGMQKYGFPCSVDDAIAAIGDVARLGFTAMELEGVGDENLRELAARRQEIGSRAQAVGVQMVNYGVVLPDLFGIDRDGRRRALDTLNYALETAAYLGCSTFQFNAYATAGVVKFIGESPYSSNAHFYDRTFRVQVDPNFSWSELWSALVDAVQQANQMAKGFGLRTCMEGRVGDLIQNTAWLLRLMDAVGDPNFGAVLDVAHAHAQKEIIPLSVEQLAGRIFYVHVADNDGRTNEHKAAGQGTIDWDGAYLALRKHHYDGYFGVDVGNVPDLDGDYITSRVFLEQLGQRLDAQPNLR
jgi:sugar phosphate isomerase/epimerase